jgi:hypothetical protein
MVVGKGLEAAYGVVVVASSWVVVGAVVVVSCVEVSVDESPAGELVGAVASVEVEL